MRTSEITRNLALGATLALCLGCQSGSLVGEAIAAGGPELLNSQRIERTFGGFGIEVLSADAELRVSNLYSTEEAGRICRTFAVVAFPAQLAPELAEPHSLVLAGRSIGETFEAAGWAIQKHHRYFGEIADVEALPRVAALMGLDTPANAAIHIYGFVVARSGRTVDYATIAEIHHPEYLALPDLAALYGPDVETFSVVGEALRPLLGTVLEELSDD